MKYLQAIRERSEQAQALEELFQASQREGDDDHFISAMQACYQESPDNLLYAAWYYRLQQAPTDGQGERRSINWKLAIPLSLVSGIGFWILSSSRLQFPNGMPFLVLSWAPICACFVIAFLTFTAANEKRLPVLMVASLLGIGTYVIVLTAPHVRPHYRDLMLLHLPLIAWIGTGASVVGIKSDHQNRYAFLIKSLEVFITGGLFAMAGGVFVGITVGMFEALGISLSEPIMRLLIAGGCGLIPVLVVAIAYDPFVGPLQQKFREGLGKLIATLMQLLLPLTLLVLIIYLVVIPFNFMEPFRNRDVLIVYNLMLFCIMALLIGATPVRAQNLAQKHQLALRTGILAVAILTIVVSIYALSATAYRTAHGGFTMNRLTIIGWNSINIGILILLVYKQFKDGFANWVTSLQWVVGRGSTIYAGWILFLIIAIPWIFKG